MPWRSRSIVFATGNSPIPLLANEERVAAKSCLGAAGADRGGPVNEALPNSTAQKQPVSKTRPGSDRESSNRLRAMR
jgi:hypothetical protein